MSNLRRVLERQQRKDEKIRRRCAEEDCELDEEEDKVVLVVGMLNQSRQHYYGRVTNMDRHKHSPVVRSQNDLNMLGQSPVFNNVLR
ncbi:unnamed protein product [Prunus brigantina]